MQITKRANEVSIAHDNVIFSVSFQVIDLRRYFARKYFQINKYIYIYRTNIFKRGDFLYKTWKRKRERYWQQQNDIQVPRFYMGT